MSSNLVVPNLFGEDDLYSPRSIREYLNRVRRVSRMGSADLWDTKEQLHTILSNTKGHAVLLGFDSRYMATRIVEPLGQAAMAYDAAAGLATATWTRFSKEFKIVIEAERANSGRSGRKMDWTDA